MCSNEKFRLLVTQDAVLERDLFVINELRNRNIPTVMVPSGGYTNESHVLIAKTVESLYRDSRGEAGR
jgi:histone deacetylase 11